MAAARQLALDMGPVCGVVGCCAPLCPRDRESMANSVWYPGEPVCSARPSPEWVRTQRRLARSKAARDTIFTVRMLRKLTSAGREARGVDPEQPERARSYRLRTARPKQGKPDPDAAKPLPQATLWQEKKGRGKARTEAGKKAETSARPRVRNELQNSAGRRRERQAAPGRA